MIRAKAAWLIVFLNCLPELVAIESRKRHIPHANGIGTWDHTTYFVIVDGEETNEYYTLKDAKEYADALNR